MVQYQDRWKAEALEALFEKMVEYDRGDARRIQHFVKVHSFARRIGIAEQLTEEELFTLEAAAIVHDIGIHKAEEKYGQNTGKYQEELGPAEAEQMLSALQFPAEVIARVSFLVGHHHTYHHIADIDYQILVEADFLVNLQEEDVREESIRACRERIFRTEAGKRFCTLIFGL